MAAKFAHHAKAVFLHAFLDGGCHVAQGSPRLDGGKAALHALARDLDELLALLAHLANAEHAARVGIVAVEDCGAVYIHDVALMQHVLFAGDAMAHDVVDRGADAFGVALVVEVGGDAAVLCGVLVDPLVDLFGGHAGVDVLAHVVEGTDVDGCRALDALDILGRFVEASRQHVETFVPGTLELLVKGLVALLVLLPAAAPAGVVAARGRTVVIHG